MRAFGWSEDDSGAQLPKSGPFQVRHYRHLVGVRVGDHLSGADCGQQPGRLSQQFTSDSFVEQTQVGDEWVARLPGRPGQARPSGLPASSAMIQSPAVPVSHLEPGQVVSTLVTAGMEILHLGEYAEPFWRAGDLKAAAWVGCLPNTFSLLARRR